LFSIKKGAYIMAVNEKYSDAITFEIIEKIGVLREKPNGWNREINLVSWNGGPPRFDIREWDPEHKKMSKGISFNRNEINVLKGILEKDKIELAVYEPSGEKNDDEFSYDIVKKMGVLSTAPSGWRREANIISWNGASSKFDIREWEPNYDKMSKGITFDQEDFGKFDAMLKSFDINKLPDLKNLSKDATFTSQTLLHPISARLSANPEVKTVTTDQGEQKVCNMLFYVETGDMGYDKNKDVPTKVTAWNDIAEELAANYTKDDTIQFFGKPTPIMYKPEGAAKEHLDTGYKIVYINHDKTLKNDVIKLQNQYLPDRLAYSKEINKGLERTGPIDRHI